MLYVTSDHGGFELKKYIVDLLLSQKIEHMDMGPKEFDEEDDYPDYVIPVMGKVQENPKNKAIVICKNGVGVSVLANKFEGIRCVLTWGPNHAASSRTDDNANVLALPADYIDKNMAREITLTWLTTPFSHEERHKRRLRKVAQAKS